jgi:hypothetical protein
MYLSRALSAFIIGLIVVVFSMGSVYAESFWECSATGVEKNGSRKIDIKFRLDATGQFVSGQVVIPKTSKDKASFPGGEYTYSGGGKVTRDDGPYEWVMEANWTGANDNSSPATSLRQGTVMVRKLKIQNIAEMQMKSKDGTVWFLFPHGCDYKQVNTNEKVSE